MDDIVTELRARRERVNYGNGDVRVVADELCEMAAAEIERLRSALSEVARLRLATDEGSLRVRADRMWEIARTVNPSSPPAPCGEEG